MHFPARYSPSQVGLMIQISAKRKVSLWLLLVVYWSYPKWKRLILKHIHMNRFLSRWMKLIWGKTEAQVTELSKVLRTFWCKAVDRSVFLNCKDGWWGFNRVSDHQPSYEKGRCLQANRSLKCIFFFPSAFRSWIFKSIKQLIPTLQTCMSKLQPMANLFGWIIVPGRAAVPNGKADGVLSTCGEWSCYN